jgi:hypothetical protein
LGGALGAASNRRDYKMASKLNLHANCASCKRGEITAPADVYVQGTIVRNDRKIPYRAYLCNEHLDLMHDDGDANDLTVTSIDLDAMAASDTAFQTFAELCQKHHNPTLRNPLLRRAYNEHMAAKKLPHRAYA